MSGVPPISQQPRAFWKIRYQEARTHALIGALVLWAGAAIATFGSTGDRNLVDHLKGEDFIQIYTLAHAAFEGEYPTLESRDGFYNRQVELVPASRGDLYLPVYPPTAALVFRPLAAFSYRGALAIWTLLTITGYGCIVWGAWRPVRSTLPDTGFVWRAAIVFPPFFLLVLFGQTTLLPLAAFFLAWAALRAGRPIAAGMSLGLLAVKPQFGLVVGVVLLCGGNWRVLLGLMLSLIIQIAGVTWSMGSEAISGYARTMSELPRIEYLLEPDGWRMHSVRTLTRLIPGVGGDIVWASASLWIVITAVRVWRSGTPLGPKFGVLLFATVLVNPHLFGYDAVVLAPAIIWLGAWLEQVGSPARASYWQSIYLLSVLFLVPTALLIRVQMSVVVMLWLFWRISRELNVTPVAQSTA